MEQLQRGFPVATALSLIEPTQRSGMGLKAMREVERRASEAKCPLYRAADVNPLVLLCERWSMF